MSLPKSASGSPEEILVPLTLTGRKPDLRHDGRDLEERELVSCKGIFALGLDEMIDGNQDADGDEAAREIEWRPVKVRPVEVEKINDFTVCDPIDQVANRAAEDKGKSGDQSRFSVG